MKLALSILSLLLLVSCNEQASLSLEDFASRETEPEIDAGSVHSYEELQHYLRAKYGEGNFTELPFAAIMSSSEDNHVTYSYRLANRTEFEIPIIYTTRNERILDPEFDLNTLPSQDILSAE